MRLQTELGGISFEDKTPKSNKIDFFREFGSILDIFATKLPLTGLKAKTV
jgi:hypothetical protein